MAELEADTVVILSSDLISKIVGEYFNRKMFKENVEIVDLKPTETGYMFSVAFVSAKKVVVAGIDNPPRVVPLVESVVKDAEINPFDKVPARASNGKFTKVK